MAKTLLGFTKVVAVIPCHNEGNFIKDVVEEIIQFVDDVIVADDGSSDNTVKAIEGMNGIIVNGSKQIQRGVGNATRRGINLALLRNSDLGAVVTLDGDGQHNPDEIPDLLEPLQSGDADITVGVRKDWTEMPAYRKLGNTIITWLYNLGMKKKISDSQCCFRAFSKRVLNEIDITENGFGFSTEMLIKARAKGYRIKEIPVSCIYHSEYCSNSTLNPLWHGLSVVWATIKWRIKIELLKAS